VQFALKIFRDNGEQTVKDFHRESTMLDELSGLPHDHVVPHLASWTQGGKFYMLFPLADCNLKTYLSENETPLLTRDFVIWLLGQMHGLADGVSHLHNLGVIITQSTIASQLPNVAHRERTCFHHDLKPENILVFRQKHTRYPVLKISDFGSGRIGRLRSGMKGSYATKNPTHGTLEYEGPDWMLDQKTSRPYDIWSLGCIFLEVLLWTSGQEHPDDFANERLQHRDDAQGLGRSTKFWCIDKKFKLRHKPIVTAWYKRLKKHCRGRGAFEDVIKTTWGMLKLQPKSRTKAHSVANDFAAMMKSATRDLRDDPDFFLKSKEDSAEAFRSSKKVAAPLSVISSQRSRSQSVDNRSDQGPHSQYLIPNSPVIQTIKRSHKKKTESVSINIPVSDIDRDWVTQTNVVLPEITVADDNSDESYDSDEMQLGSDLPGSPYPGSPQILLGEGSMAPRGRAREALHTLEEADSLTLSGPSY
jgi:serine/threonine protein kinase